MDLIQSVMDFLSNNGKLGKEAPDGVCPNCWGRQEYGGKITDYVKDKQIDVNNHQSSYAFIQGFVVDNIKGIQLKNTSTGHKCPNCNRTY